MKKRARTLASIGIGVLVVVAFGLVIHALLPKLLPVPTPGTPTAASQIEMSPIATLKVPGHPDEKPSVAAQPAAQNAPVPPPAQPAPSAAQNPTVPPSTPAPVAAPAPVAQVSPPPQPQTAAPPLSRVTPDASSASTTAPAASAANGNDESAEVKKEVLERIDLMPKLSSGDRTKLYEAVDHARGMFKLAVVPFETGRTVPVQSTVGQLGERLRAPDARRLLADPTVIVVVLGYADSKGNEKSNLQISGDRAENLVKVLRDQDNVLNVMHAVGMGTSQLFSREQLEKNRVAEVWAVLPY